MNAVRHVVFYKPRTESRPYKHREHKGASLEISWIDSRGRLVTRYIQVSRERGLQALATGR